MRFSGFIERIAYCNRKYAKLTAHRLKKRGLIKEVARNAYTTKENIFVIASNITYPSYISFWSASYFLGYTEQIVNTVHIAVTRRIKPIKFEGYLIKFVPLKDFFGYKKIHTSEGDIFVAEDEKLLIDAFLKYRECGNFKKEKINKNSIVFINLRSQYIISFFGKSKRGGQLWQKKQQWMRMWFS